MKFLLLSLLALLPSCMTAKDGASGVKITNGMTPNETWKNVVPMLKDYDNQSHFTSCTAALVGPNVVVTAEHCLLKQSNEVVKNYFDIVILGQNKVAYGAKVISPPADVIDAAHIRQITAIDVAVVILKDELHAKTLAVDTAADRSAGTDVVIAGYGGTDAAHPTVNTGMLKLGSNKLAVSHDQNTLAIEGYIVAPTSSPDGSNSATALGDSGGPLLSQDGKSVLGVTSSGRIDGTSKLSFFADLASQPNRFLLCLAAKEGATIPSLKPIDCQEFGVLDHCKYEVPANSSEAVRIKC